MLPFLLGNFCVFNLSKFSILFDRLGSGCWIVRYNGCSFFHMCIIENQFSPQKSFFVTWKVAGILNYALKYFLLYIFSSEFPGWLFYNLSNNIPFIHLNKGRKKGVSLMLAVEISHHKSMLTVYLSLPPCRVFCQFSFPLKDKRLMVLTFKLEELGSIYFCP